MFRAMISLFRFRILLVLIAFLLAGGVGAAADANRLTYLDSSDPFYVHRDFPKLTTPQWVGEEGVEAVVTLAIDDMKATAKYESYLRPILERLKQIDGRAPVSIMTVRINPDEPQLQTWLNEGLNIDVHTLTHPCPLLQKGDFAGAANVVHGGVDLLSGIPGNLPVGYRMPCCDSMNSASPRFFAEIFNRANSAGQFLSIDSSIFNITSTNDSALPRDWVIDADGGERFRKYLPKTPPAPERLGMGYFVTTIEDYPYPFVIGGLCWEFPPMVPSDWEAQNLHGPNNPRTLEDFKACLDVAVKKQGTYNLVFHPHGWIRNDQIVELIDYAVTKYGKKVKFLNFRDAAERLNRNLLKGRPLRAVNGQDNGVRLMDLNDDGFMDVVAGNEQSGFTRVWQPEARKWKEAGFPAAVTLPTKSGKRNDAGVRFGVVRKDGQVTALARSEKVSKAWRFDGESWVEDLELLAGLQLDGKALFASEGGRDRGLRFRDVDSDGRCELIVGNESQNVVLKWSDSQKLWEPMSFGLPPGTSIVNAKGQDNGLRFVDVNEDGHDDVIFSNEEAWSVNLYIANAVPRLGWFLGWSHSSRAGQRGDPGEIPMIARGGATPNNGAWFHSGHMWLQNEDTAHLPDKVDRRSFKDLLSIPVPKPKSPQEALNAFTVADGYMVEVVAAEPMVIDPIAFDWGADGRLWVVEMGDYPNGIDGSGKSGGVVRFLTDTNDDGKYDKSTVFMDGVNFPTGVIEWRKGVLVSAAPEIFYAEDNDGDGKADVRKTIFKGFKEGNQQHRVNGFQYGLDNWIYGANGDSGGKVILVESLNGKKGGKAVDINGRDFRFNPDTGEFQAQAGQTQFGRNHDDWGDWFGNNNPNWLWHYHLPEHYLARNPHQAVGSTKDMLARYADGQRCFPSSATITRWNQPQSANYVTSGCSAAPYRGKLFGEGSDRWVFISEPVHNLVHREVIVPQGSSLTSRRHPDDKGREFLSSSDNWFRPTMTKTGPDGALYVADMYRFVIEHPEWISPQAQAAVDVRLGSDKGRIYRVYPKGYTLKKFKPLNVDGPIVKIQALANPNGWVRDKAQQLLVNEKGKEAGGLARYAFRTGPTAKTRIQAMCVADGLDALDTELLLGALKDPDADVRRHGVRLCEGALRKGFADVTAEQAGALAEALSALVNDESARVRQQLAFTMGEWRDARAGQILGRLALKDQNDRNVMTAIMSSAVPHLAEMIDVVVNVEGGREPSGELVEQTLGLAAALDLQHSVADALNAVAGDEGAPLAAWKLQAVVGFLGALDGRNTTLAKFEKEASPELKEAIGRLDRVFVHARKVTQDPDADLGERLTAVRILGHGLQKIDEDSEALSAMLNARNPVDVQKAALESLRKVRHASTPDFLIRGWSSYTPAIRVTVADALLSRRDWLTKLLDAIQKHQISGSQISVAHRQKLTGHRDKEIRERAGRLFTAVGSNRAGIIEEYQVVNRLVGDPRKGREMFRAACMVCHRYRDEGNEIGPDMASMSGKAVPDLLTAILDPNAAVEDKFISYTATLRGDREVAGVIASETPTTLIFKTAAGATETVLRRDLLNLKATGLSLMPEGFEAAIKPQTMADLIAYIGGGVGAELKAKK